MHEEKLPAAFRGFPGLELFSLTTCVAPADDCPIVSDGCPALGDGFPALSDDCPAVRDAAVVLLIPVLSFCTGWREPLHGNLKLT